MRQYSIKCNSSKGNICQKNFKSLGIKKKTKCNLSINNCVFNFYYNIKNFYLECNHKSEPE